MNSPDDHVMKFEQQRDLMLPSGSKTVLTDIKYHPK